jgi:hypothetical protein
MKLFILGVLLLLLIAPASAYIANASGVMTSYTDTQFANQNYIPYQYEMMLIGLGVVCWILMRYAQDLEVLFGLLAIIIFGAAAWFAAYMSINEVFTLVDMTNGETTVLYTQFVTPQPILQIILVVCFLFAIIIELYTLFLREADKKLELERTGRKGYQ